MFPVIALSQETAIQQIPAMFFGILPFLIASFTIGIGIFQPASWKDSQRRRNFRPWKCPAWNYSLERYWDCSRLRHSDRGAGFIFRGTISAGVSRSETSEDSAMKVLKSLSIERWTYYLDDVLPRDRSILVKLSSTKPVDRWIELINKLDLSAVTLNDRLVTQLIRASRDRKKDRIQRIAGELLKRGIE